MCDVPYLILSTGLHYFTNLFQSYVEPLKGDKVATDGEITEPRVAGAVAVI